MERTLIVVPTYNERENVSRLSEMILAALPDGEILFVDDGSPDGTGDVCDALAAENGKIHVMHRKAKQGLGKAYLAGFSWALERKFDLIFEMDADFSHNPADLPRFVEAAKEFDLVLGSRYIGGIRVMNWPLGRLLISTFAGVFVRIVTGLPVMDPTGGYKCFRRKVLESIDFEGITSSGYSFQIEMTHNAWMKGFKITEIPIVFEDRREGQSKMSKDIAVEAFFKVWKLAAKSLLGRRARGAK